MKRIKIILADDHQIVRDGIKAILSGETNLEIVAEASDGKDLLDKLQQHKPDIVIVDISMPLLSGIDAAKMITENFPNVKILILSMYTDEEFINNSIKAGVKGFLPKNTTKDELINAIHCLYMGEEYFSSEVSKIMLKSYVKQVKEGPRNAQKDPCLTPRELEILKLYAEGYTNQEIADKLFISIRTVETHKTHIMQKLELKSTIELAKYAIKNNIVKL